jgi:hypothetical protein
MLSKYMKYNSKHKSMLLAQIVVAFVMFIFVIDKGFIYNFINNLHKVNYINLDVLLLDIMSISKVSMINHLLFIGLGYALLGILVTVSFLISLNILFVHLVKFFVTIYKNNVNSEKFVKVPENNIYLLTNKFIC